MTQKQTGAVFTLDRPSPWRLKGAARPVRRAGLGLLLLLAVFGVTGCRSLPKPTPEWSARRAVEVGNTTWARTLAPMAAGQEGLTGVQLLLHGNDALAARLALVDTAERTLDIQYYIWEPDAAGQLLAERLLRAAERGVYVRLLVDDIGSSKAENLLRTINAHTNLEVRLFNPVANRTFPRLSMLADLKRINRRMHNKSFTADQRLTIVGGRNVAECYYAFGEDPQFADFDVLAAGPVVGELAVMFDRYFHSRLAIPAEALMRKSPSPEQVAKSQASLVKEATVLNRSAEYGTLASNQVGQAIRRHEPSLAWGPARLVCDQPEKATTNPNDKSMHMFSVLRADMEKVQQELILISPYFVPGAKGVEAFRELKQRGVRVVILSNSLAANDVVSVHVGYRRYRKALLRAGVELWELKPDAQIHASMQAAKSGQPAPEREQPAGASLHAKSFILDRQKLFVGSLNFDPRSVIYNTELGLVMAVPSLAGPVADGLERRLAEMAYRLEFVPGPGPSKECGKLVWHGVENGRAVRYTREPHASFGRRSMVNFLSLLPIEGQL